MNAEEFSKLITSDKVQILDVRTADEYAESHIPGSKNVDVLQSDFEQRTADILDAAKPVAVYCRSGKRSMVAAAKLIARGMKVYNLDGGILQWLQENKPVE
ncbi:MAG: rhodanese-like domain-containing protein [Prevotellaceae bacterium]|nr:rhodanese-like domain-containing protein [Prevotella sp.]MDD7530185.1 rhodanese-like domain-containing protein [Prevotellaceae bacterium]MDY2633425.1 rhodanese-like domain-containing protein [Prevotella sp.]